MSTRTCLCGLLGAAMALMVGVLTAGRVQAEQKVPVRTAVLTAHDSAAIQATPVHWVHGRYYGVYRAYYRPAYRYGYVYPRFYGYYRPRYYYPAATVYPYYSYYSPYVYPYAYPYTTVPMALTPTGHVLPAAVVGTPYGSYYW